MTNEELSPKQQAYISAIEYQGFVLILEENFVHEKSNEKSLLFLHPDGVILHLVTYHNSFSFNSIHIFYNWTPNNLENANNFTSSGHWICTINNKKVPHDGNWDSPDSQKVWIGNSWLDTNSPTNFISKFSDLQKNGHFVFPWIECPTIWWLNYVEEKDRCLEDKRSYKFDLDRFNKTPKEFQQQFAIIKEWLESHISQK